MLPAFRACPKALVKLLDLGRSPFEPSIWGLREAEEREMQAYRISRFGSVDGIERQSRDDPRPGVAGGLDAGARELAQLP